MQPTGKKVGNSLLSEYILVKCFVSLSDLTIGGFFWRIPTPGSVNIFVASYRFFGIRIVHQSKPLL